MDGNNNSGAFFAGFLMGGLVGAVAALLLTPQTGERTRLQLQARGIELKTQVDDIRSEIQQKSQDLIEQKMPRGGTKEEEEASEVAEGEED